MAYIDGKEILFSARVTGGGGAEIVNTLAGDEADKAPSVKAVNEGLDGMHLVVSMDDKAFKLTVSLLNKNDDVLSTHTIDLPLEEMIVSGKVSDDGKNIVLTLKNGETIEFGVSALVGGFATKEDLNGKVSTNTESNGYQTLYGRKSNGTQVEFTLLSNNYHTSNGGEACAAMYVKPTHSSGFLKNDQGGVLNTSTPRQPLNCANMKYVDDNIATITSQLGSFIKTDMVYGGREHGGFPVPDNAYPAVYLSDPSFTANNADGSTAYAGRATRLYFLDHDQNVIGSEDIEDYTNSACFVVIPEGTKSINLNIDELAVGWDTHELYYWGYALFQVKGGA